MSGMCGSASRSLDARILATLMTLVLVVGLGCDRDKHSTGVHIITSLPAIGLSEDPIAKKTDWQLMTELNDSLLSASFPDAPAADIQDENADIQLQFAHPDTCPYSDIFVVDSATGISYALQRRVPGLMSFDGRPGSCLLSTSLRSVRELLYGPANRLYIASAQIRTPSARLLNYRADYRFITIPPTRIPIAFTYVHGRLMVIDIPVSDPWHGDAARFMDATGQLLGEIPVLGIRTNLWTSSDRGLWAIDGSEPVQVMLCDSSLSVTSGFTLAGLFDRVSPGVTWAIGRLWVVDKYANRILGIDVDSSLAAGSAVIPDTITIHSSADLYFTRGFSWDGVHFCLGLSSGRLMRISPDGDTAASLPLPSRVEAMAWDGEAMWIMHGGGGGATTDATLLSRFYLW